MALGMVGHQLHPSQRSSVKTSCARYKVRAGSLQGQCKMERRHVVFTECHQRSKKSSFLPLLVSAVLWRIQVVIPSKIITLFFVSSKNIRIGGEVAQCYGTPDWDSAGPVSNTTPSQPTAKSVGPIGGLPYKTLGLPLKGGRDTKINLKKLKGKRTNAPALPSHIQTIDYPALPSWTPRLRNRTACTVHVQYFLQAHKKRSKI
jgi:hypothetical protein